MNSRLIFCGIYLLIFMFSLTLNSNAQNSNISKEDTSFRSPFRYVIVSSKIDPKVGKGDKERRFVEVLIDKKSFSKENLITLFRLVTKRFPKPHLLYINVFTDLNDIETPEEREQSKFSDIEAIGERAGDLAVFVRNNKKMYFYIYAANRDFEEIEIK